MKWKSFNRFSRAHLHISIEVILTGVTPTWWKFNNWKHSGPEFVSDHYLTLNSEQEFFLVASYDLRGSLSSAWELQKMKIPVNNTRPPMVWNTVTTIEKLNIMSYISISHVKTISSCAYEDQKLTFPLQCRWRVDEIHSFIPSFGSVVQPHRFEQNTFSDRGTICLMAHPFPQPCVWRNPIRF